MSNACAVPLLDFGQLQTPVAVERFGAPKLEAARTVCETKAVLLGKTGAFDLEMRRQRVESLGYSLDSRPGLQVLVPRS